MHNNNNFTIKNGKTTISEREVVAMKKCKKLLYAYVFVVILIFASVCYAKHDNIYTISVAAFILLLLMFLPYIQYKAQIVRYTCFYLFEIEINDTENVIKYLDQRDQVNVVRCGLMECNLKYKKFDVVFDSIGKSALIFYDYRESRTEPSLFQFKILDWDEEKMKDVSNNFHLKKSILNKRLHTKTKNT